MNRIYSESEIEEGVESLINNYYPNYPNRENTLLTDVALLDFLRSAHLLLEKASWFENKDLYYRMKDKLMSVCPFFDPNHYHPDGGW
ncbi:MAG: hypothetical protein AB4372_21435 [Xenococcus sp. (in: cyanobacteria)]